MRISIHCCPSILQSSRSDYIWQCYPGRSTQLLEWPCLTLRPGTLDTYILQPATRLLPPLQPERRVPVHGGAGGGEDGAGQAHGAGPHPRQGVHRRAHRQDQRAAAGVATLLPDRRQCACAGACCQPSHGFSVARAPCCVAMLLQSAAALLSQRACSIAEAAWHRQSLVP